MARIEHVSFNARHPFHAVSSFRIPSRGPRRRRDSLRSFFFCRSFDGARVVAALSARRELRLTVQFPRSSSLSQSTIASSAEFELANMVRDRSSRPGSAPPRLHRTIY